MPPSQVERPAREPNRLTGKFEACGLGGVKFETRDFGGPGFTMTYYPRPDAEQKPRPGETWEFDVTGRVSNPAPGRWAVSVTPIRCLERAPLATALKLVATLQFDPADDPGTFMAVVEAANTPPRHRKGGKKGRKARQEDAE